MLSISRCFNAIQKYYGRFVPKHPFVCILTSWHISIPAWQLSPDPEQPHCNLESLQEPHYIEAGINTYFFAHNHSPPTLAVFTNQTIADWGFPLGRGGDRQAPWKHPPIVHYLACRCINEPLPQIPGLPSASLLMYQSKVISGVSGKMLGVFIPALNISRNPLQKIRFPNGFC